MPGPNPADPPMPESVAATFASHPPVARRTLLAARALIFALADETDTGPLTETLKWGEPAYLTEATKAGSTIRLGLADGRPAVLFNCRTTLVDGFRADFPDVAFSGDRALLLSDDDATAAALPICLARALTYHHAKRNGGRP